LCLEREKQGKWKEYAQQGTTKKKNQQKTPWPKSENELYEPSDRRLSAKLVPTLSDAGHRK
jgi:hypothetical protein